MFPAFPATACNMVPLCNPIRVIYLLQPDHREKAMTHRAKRFLGPAKRGRQLSLLLTAEEAGKNVEDIFDRPPTNVPLWYIAFIPGIVT